MGYGDFKLFAALGAWLGWQMLLPIILFASGVGAIVGIVVMIRQRMGTDTPIAFGPFLAVAGWLGLMFGHAVRRLATARSCIDPGADRDAAAVPSGTDRWHRQRQEHRRQSVRGAGRAPSSIPICSRAKSWRPARRCSPRSPRHFGDRCCGSRRQPRPPRAARAGVRESGRKAVAGAAHASGDSRADGPALRIGAPGPMCMVAIPLLVETQGASRFDRVLVVDCEPADAARAPAGARRRHFSSRPRSACWRRRPLANSGSRSRTM